MEEQRLSDPDRENFDPDDVKESLRNVLTSASGRFYLWYLLDKLGPFRAPVSTNGVLASDRELLANGTKQAIGIELLGEIREADIALSRVMEDEADDRRRRQHRGGPGPDDDDAGDDGRPADHYAIE
ncbi:MAG: hypothetical protein AAF661_04975 [Pseudomonadota bacterium]